jgi:hypothetical protein
MKFRWNEKLGFEKLMPRELAKEIEGVLKRRLGAKWARCRVSWVTAAHSRNVSDGAGSPNVILF